MNHAPDQPHVSSGPRYKRLVFRILFGISLALNVALFVWSRIDLRSGGGQVDASPDNKYTALAESLQNTVGNKDVYYVLSLENSAGQQVKRVRIDMNETRDAMYFRRLPKIIQWSPDSKEVVFTIPGMQVKMDRELHPDDPAPAESTDDGRGNLNAKSQNDPAPRSVAQTQRSTTQPFGQPVVATPGPEDVVVRKLEGIPEPKGELAGNPLFAYFANKPEESQFDCYTTENWKDNYRLFAATLVKKAKAAGLDSQSLERVLEAHLAEREKDDQNPFAELPVGAYETVFENVPVWIVTFKWEYNERQQGQQGRFLKLSHIAIFAVDRKTLKVVAHASCA